MHASPVQRLLTALIRGYRYLLSPVMGRQCRFHPSCSHYAEEAIRVHGSGYGSWLALRRLLRCQPFCPGGLDPVPGSDRAAVAEAPDHAT